MSTPLRQLSDPQKEELIAGCIAGHGFELIPEDKLIPEEAFSLFHWRLVYRMARKIRSDNQPVCGETVNEYIRSYGLDEEFRKSYAPASFSAWVKWAEQIDHSAEIHEELQASGIRLVCFYLDELLAVWQRRQAHQIGQDVVDGIIGPHDAAMALLGLNGSNGKLPKRITWPKAKAQAPPEPAEIIAGVLHRGAKLAIGGASKSYKTWFLLDLGVSVACGLPWLGEFAVEQSRVLYLNFELLEFAIIKRLDALASALGVEASENFELWNLRGQAKDAEEILPELATASQENSYGLIVIDPVYKLLGDSDENSARDITKMMNAVERFSVETGAAIAFGSHFAKGNASGKESIDRIAGSGVFARDPDAILTLTQHDQDNAYAADFTLRNFAPVESFVLSWNYPRFAPDPTLDPRALRAPRKGSGGRPRDYDLKQFVSFFSVLDGMEDTQARELLMAEMKMSRRSYYRRREEAIEEGLITEINGKLFKC
jgi:AAA domain